MLVRMQYRLWLGSLISQLHTLELLLRHYAHFREPSKPGLDFFALKVGDKLPATALTDYKSLTRLMNDFNQAMASMQIEGLSREIVDLRDALAHGRVLGETAGPPLTLVKFGREAGTPPEVIVEVAATMTEDWFQTQQRLVSDATKVVAQAIQREFPTVMKLVESPPGSELY